MTEAAAAERSGREGGSEHGQHGGPDDGQEGGHDDRRGHGQDSSQDSWDRALLRLDPDASLLQSAGHAEVQVDEGWRPQRLLLPSGARALVLIGGPPGLRHGYVPRGPVPATAETCAELAEWARDAGLVRIRVEPEAPPDLRDSLFGLGFRLAPSMLPQHTLQVRLGPPEAVLASFKPKHRYNIRLAERRGVSVEVTGDVEELRRQHLATAARQQLRPPGLGHYRRRLERYRWCRVYVARVDAEAVAAIMVARFGERAYYLFGGSSGAHRNLMPAYAAQWAAIRDASAAGLRRYDLWGLPPSAEPEHPWHGLWQFKTGFGGDRVTYAGGLELELVGARARLSRLSLRQLATKRRLAG